MLMKADSEYRVTMQITAVILKAMYRTLYYCRVTLLWIIALVIMVIMMHDICYRRWYPEEFALAPRKQAAHR